MKTIGQTLRMLREAKGMTASKLADKIGVDKSYVSLIENDSRSPSVAVLHKFSKELGVPFSFLADVVTGTRGKGTLHTALIQFEQIDSIRLLWIVFASR